MKFRYYCIQLYVGLLGMGFVSHAQELGPYECIPEEPEKEAEKECTQGSYDAVEKKYDDGIAKLENVYKDDLECEEQEPDDDNFKTCKELNDSICELEFNKVKTVEKLKDSCKDLPAAETRWAEAMVAMAVLDPDSSFDECQTTTAKKKREDEKLDLVYVSLIKSFAGIKIGLELKKELVPDIPLIGDVGKTPFIILIGVVDLMILSVEALQIELHRLVKDLDIEDGFCNTKLSTYMKELAEETFEFLEVIDKNLDEKADKNQDTIDNIEAKVDIIDTNVDDNQLILEFLSCRFAEADQMITFVGGGCDGVDNDCDSTVLDTFGEDRTFQTITNRIDECDEDRVPPTITLASYAPESFASQDEAEKWFFDNTLVSDDCVPQARLVKSIVSPSTAGEVSIKVVDPRCEKMSDIKAFVNGKERVVDGPGESSATKIFPFVVDGDAPTVTCGFYKPQDINYVDGTGTSQEANGDHTDPLFIDFYTENKNLVNVGFWYQVQENPPNPGEEVDVEIVVTSNEYEDLVHGTQMHQIIETRNLGPPTPVRRVTLLLAPFTCRDYVVDSAQNNCLVEKDTTARFYDIDVSATDTSGNKETVTCTVAVVPEYYASNYSKSSKSSKKKGRRGLTNDTRSRALAPSKGTKGKGAPPPPPPTREELLLELSLSKQRYLLQEYWVVWDTGLDDGKVTPVPTPAPTPRGKGKSSRKSKKSAKNNRRYE